MLISGMLSWEIYSRFIIVWITGYRRVDLSLWGYRGRVDLSLFGCRGRVDLSLWRKG